MTDSTLTQAQLSQAQTSSNTSSDSSASASTSIAMNGDISARRDAASLMMTMSHLMGAHQAQQQHQGNPSAGVAGSLPSAQAVLNGMSNSHHNHTNRGPHKKRTASNAALDGTGGRSVAAHHLVNGGGVLRLPITGNTTASSVSSAMTDATATSATGAKGDKSIESPTANGSNAPLSEEEKKAERRAANRRSAFQSRQRRKILIEDLQRTVAALSKDNNDLRKTNDEIRSQLEAALIENRQLRQITSSLSAQAHAQVAAQSAPQQPASGPQAQQQQQQQQQSSATSGSPNLSAQQAPVHKPPPTISVAPTPAPPASFNPAALTNFLTNFSSQVTAAAPADQQQHIFNAKLALMAAQTRVSELEHHQAAQAAAVAQQQQLQAHAAAFGLAQVQQQASNLNDAQHFARLQELLTLGIGNASAAVAAANPAAAAAAPHPTAANGTNNAAGVDLTHLRCLLEAQQQQQQQATPTAPQAPESPSRSQSAPQEHESSKPTTETSNSFANQSTTKGVEAPPTVTPPSPAPATSATNLPTSGTQDAPGIQLLIESLRSGQVAGNGQATGGAPLDEAVRNYIQQQQLAQQQQQQNSATSIKAESN